MFRIRGTVRCSSVYSLLTSLITLSGSPRDEPPSCVVWCGVSGLTSVAVRACILLPGSLLVGGFGGGGASLPTLPGSHHTQFAALPATLPDDGGMFSQGLFLAFPTPHCLVPVFFSLLVLYLVPIS